MAFFSLSPRDIHQLNQGQSRLSRAVLKLQAKPKQLLATIVIGTNLASIGLILLSSFLISALFDFSRSPAAGFIMQVVAVAFVLLLLGEITPKIYASQHRVSLARFVAFPLVVLEKMLFPLSALLIATTGIFDRVVKKRTPTISVDELSHALELTSKDVALESEKKILKGIVRFGNTDVKQIMKPRMEITACTYSTPFTKLVEEISSSGFSRIPVYRDTLDRVAGIVYAKDLLPHLGKGDDFQWPGLLREAFFVPENKKIDDLLREFQYKKMHMAIVADEFGGTSGLVTLEDVIEEIVGEINDEFDDDDLVYSRLSDKNFVFEGKISLNDLSRILQIDSDIFEIVKGDSDTLGGFITEITKRIPQKGEQVQFRDITFTIESADGRKIKRVKVSLPD